MESFENKNEYFGALCIEDLNYPSSQIFFKKGYYYKYSIKKHEETGIKIYYVTYTNDKTSKEEELPMIEDNFKKHFNDVQVIRDKKINWLLKNKEKNKEKI
jgi:hypothetical protein